MDQGRSSDVNYEDEHSPTARFPTGDFKHTPIHLDLLRGIELSEFGLVPERARSAIFHQHTSFTCHASPANRRSHFTSLLPRQGNRMLMLAIDTATRSGSVALLDKGHIVGARYFDTNLEHSRRLFVEIDELLERSGQQAAALDGVAVSVGPGSYTGLRIGLSAAKGLCLASGAALVTVSTLDAIAAGLPHCVDTVCAIVAARSGEACWALYDTSDGHLQSLSTPRIDSVTEVLDRLPEAPVILCGEGAVAFVDPVQDFPHYRCAPEPIGKPQACYVGHLGSAKLMAGDTEDLDSVEPEYMRTPNYETAVEQRARKASTTAGDSVHHVRR